MTNKFNLILQEKTKLTDNTEHFKFTLDAPEPLDFKAGQFISLHIEKDGKEHRRNYSIANAPDGNLIELAMAYMPNGLASTLLNRLQPGDSVPASGPYGQFVLKDEILPARYILIGTGTGITPYRSMLKQLSSFLESSSLQVVILQGVRTANDLLYGDEFTAFADKYSNAMFKACYSRGENANGYVQDNFASLNIKPGADIVYLCGNPAMVDDAFAKLQELGLDRANIRREKYISGK